MFITTARGRNHAKSMLDMAQTRDDWFSEVLPVNVTNAMSEEAVEQQRLEYTGIFGKEAADALIDQEYYCSFEAAILGAYWGKEMLLVEQQGRIWVTCRSTGICRCRPPGTSASTTLWRSGASRSTLTTLTSWTTTRATVMGFDQYCAWLDARGYPHGIDWMPHDARRFARLERLVLAPARRDALHAGPASPEAGSRPVADGRHQRRPAKRSPSPASTRRARRRAWNASAPTAPSGTRRRGPSKKKTPDHNWASHGADGWRCLSLSWRAPTCASPRKRSCRSASRLGPDITMDQFMAGH